MSIGSRIVEARKRLSMTQSELAHRLGVSQGSVANYENEFNTPKTEMMYKLFEVLNVDANFLYQDYIVSSDKQIILSNDEEVLIKGYRSLSDRGKSYILQTMEMASVSMPATKNVPSSDLENLA